MSASTWLDAAGELPDEDVLVLIALNDGEVWPAVRDHGRWIYMSGAKVTHDVKHWMHLPSAPVIQASSERRP